MTALPEPTTPREPRLLTVAEYAELGETDAGYTELQEGHVLVSPSPRPAHGIASGELFTQIRDQLPSALWAIQDMDVDLKLTSPRDPGFVRRPDIIVVDKAGIIRAESQGSLIQARDVLIAVEIVSPGSERMDHVVKRGEYADAGIPHYWIIDLDRPVSAVICHHAGVFGYQDSINATGIVRLTEPFPLTLDLDQLVWLSGSG